jgi:hypothetical protein
MKMIIRTAIGVVLGYAMMVVLITLVQEVWFGGIGWGKSSLAVLVTAGFFTALAAALGAVVAMALAGASGRIPAMIMSGLVVMETTALIATGRAGGPLWFDVVAATSLIVAILAGTELFLRLRRPPGKSLAA